MIEFKAHFDGKVIVPDEPVNFKTDERLVVQAQPTAPDQNAPPRKDFRSMVGLAKHFKRNPNPRFKSDRELWE